MARHKKEATGADLVLYDGDEQKSERTVTIKQSNALLNDNLADWCGCADDCVTINGRWEDREEIEKVIGRAS